MVEKNWQRFKVLKHPGFWGQLDFIEHFSDHWDMIQHVFLFEDKRDPSLAEMKRLVFSQIKGEKR